MQPLLRTLCLVILLLPSIAGAAGETIVILPFVNEGKTQNLGWIGEAISETVRDALFAEGFLALDRESREEGYRRLSLRPGAELTKASALKIADALDAEMVISGSFESAESDTGEAGASLTISAQVLDRMRLKQSPQFEQSGRLEELNGLEDGLAWQLLRFFGARVPTEEQYRRRRRPVRLDAMENYIRGLMANDADQKHRFFTQSARLDDGFSPPCFQLGKLHWTKKDYRVAAGWFERVGAADARYHEAQFFLGLSRYHLGEYAKAVKAFELVAASVPLNEVWNNLGAAQSRSSRPEALESFRHALEGDPLDPVYNFNTGYALWKKGEYAEAADRFRAVLNALPDDAPATAMLGRCLKRTGPAQAQTRVQSLERLKDNYDEMAYRQLQAALAPKAARTAPRER